jgi:hypothetical protein
MKISATWQNIQNCEMSFTELDSISQLQILLDSSNYNKMKLDPANATRIELLAYHCHTVEINEMSVFLSSNSCAAVDPPSPLDEATFIT